MFLDNVQYDKHKENLIILLNINGCFCYPCAVNRSTTEEPSYWWIIGLVVAVMLLAVAGMIAYLKLKGKEITR